jgi:hypothetical protein
VIALSEHVDYWNELGWPDPFSNRIFSARQSWYSEFFRNRGPYTPQMVVDGGVEFVGSDSARAQSAIAAAARIPKAGLVLEWRDSATVEVRIEPFPGFHADVFLATTEDGLSSQVRRGENGGRVLRHDGVVRTWKPVGSWKTEEAFRARVRVSGGSHVVVFAQDRGSRRVIAASQIGIRTV